jgi:hypothetical protein
MAIGHRGSGDFANDLRSQKDRQGKPANTAPSSLPVGKTPNALSDADRLKSLMPHPRLEPISRALPRPFFRPLTNDGSCHDGNGHRKNGRTSLRRRTSDARNSVRFASSTNGGTRPACCKTKCPDRRGVPCFQAFFSKTGRSALAQYAEVKGRRPGTLRYGLRCRADEESGARPRPFLGRIL